MIRIRVSASPFCGHLMCVFAFEKDKGQLSAGDGVRLFGERTCMIFDFCGPSVCGKGGCHSF